MAKDNDIGTQKLMRRRENLFSIPENETTPRSYLNKETLNALNSK